MALNLAPDEGWMMLMGSGVSSARLLGMEDGLDSTRSSLTSGWPDMVCTGGGGGGLKEICCSLDTGGGGLELKDIGCRLDTGCWRTLELSLPPPGWGSS